MKINLFETPMFMSNIDLDKIYINCNKIENKWLSNTKTSYEQNNFLDSKSYNYLMQKIAQILMPILPGFSKINLTNIWKNKYIEEDYQENHIHSNSHFSFIIYVKGESKTIFFAPHKHLLECFYGDDFFRSSYKSQFRPGQIVIFPSYLEHMVSKCNNTETYSGNLLITDINEKKAVIETVDKEKGYEC